MKKDFNKEFKTDLNNLIKNTTLKIEQYEYFSQLFGNMILVLKGTRETYKFITDKGDIYLNDSLIITNQDCVIKGKSTFDALIDSVVDLIKT